MKYCVSKEINMPREEFLKLFQDEAFMKKWQPGLQSIDHLEGELGEVGSKNKLSYVNNGKPSIIYETILKKDLPHDFNFLYEAKGVTNWAFNIFEDNGTSTTWTAVHEFKFTGLMILLNVLKKVFIKQTTGDMKAFKKHAEADYIQSKS